MKSIFDTLHFYMVAIFSVRHKILKGALLAVVSMMFYCVISDYAHDRVRPSKRSQREVEVKVAK